MIYEKGQICLIVGDEEDENEFEEDEDEDEILGPHGQIEQLCTIGNQFVKRGKGIYYSVTVGEGKWRFFVWHHHLKPFLTDEEAKEKAMELLG